MANEVLNHIMAIISKFTDLLCVDVELQNVSMKILQIFSRTLETEPSIMVWEAVSDLLNSCWIR